MIRVNLLKTDIKAGDKRPSVGVPVAAPVEIKPEKPKKSNAVNLIVFLVIAVLGALAFLQKQSIDTERALLSEAQDQQRVLTPVLQKLELVERVLPENKIRLIEAGAGKPSPSVLDALSESGRVGLAPGSDVQPIWIKRGTPTSESPVYFKAFRNHLFNASFLLQPDLRRKKRLPGIHS